MEENISVWNKKTTDLTVADNLKVAVVTTTALVIVTTVATTVASKVLDRLASRRAQKEESES